jgi:hypothetical protein
VIAESDPIRQFQTIEPHWSRRTTHLTTTLVPKHPTLVDQARSLFLADPPTDGICLRQWCGRQ